MPYLSVFQSHTILFDDSHKGFYNDVVDDDLRMYLKKILDILERAANYCKIKALNFIDEINEEEENQMTINSHI